MSVVYLLSDGQAITICCRCLLAAAAAAAAAICEWPSCRRQPRCNLITRATDRRPKKSSAVASAGPDPPKPAAAADSLCWPPARVLWSGGEMYACFGSVLLMLLLLLLSFAIVGQDEGEERRRIGLVFEFRQKAGGFFHRDNISAALGQRID